MVRAVFRTIAIAAPIAFWGIGTHYGLWHGALTAITAVIAFSASFIIFAVCAALAYGQNRTPITSYE